MKTITEFTGTLLGQVLAKDKELTNEGKTPEEFQTAREQALTELTKFEGDKLKLLFAALESVGKKTDRLKRVVVWQVGESEQGPKGAFLKDGHAYIVEHYPHPHGSKPAAASDRRDERGGRGDRRGKKGGRGGRDGRDGRDGKGRGRGPRPEGLQASAGAGADGAGTAEARPPRQPRERKKGPGPKGLGTGAMVKPNNPGALAKPATEGGATG